MSDELALRSSVEQLEAALARCQRALADLTRAAVALECAACDAIVAGLTRHVPPDDAVET
jgi:hypothetical protein